MSSVPGTVIAGHRVEDLLLDRGMHREFLDDAIDDLALLDVGPITGLFEALEQLLDGLVVGAEKGDCVHGAESVPTHPNPLNRSLKAHPRRVSSATNLSSARNDADLGVGDGLVQLPGAIVEANVEVMRDYCCSAPGRAWWGSWWPRRRRAAAIVRRTRRVGGAPSASVSDRRRRRRRARLLGSALHRCIGPRVVRGAGHCLPGSTCEAADHQSLSICRSAPRAHRVSTRWSRPKRGVRFDDTARR